MGKLQSTLLVLSAFLWLAWGWEPGNQYVYNYVGRSVAGIYKMKQQNAVIELQSRVIIQSVDESTIVVKMTDGRIMRNGKYLGNPFFTGVAGDLEQIEGDEDRIPNPEILGTPFVISHIKGSVTGIKIADGEPMWVVNFKKSIASQLQLDVTGVRPDGPVANWETAPKEGESTTYTVFEDSITGDCSATIAVSRLSWSQAVATKLVNIGSFDATCAGKPIYQIVKTKDFNRCQSNPMWQTTTSNVYNLCDFGKGNCGDFVQRIHVHKYLACGDFPRVTIVHAGGFSDLLMQPFSVKTDELVNSVVMNWVLERKEPISSRLPTPPSPKEHKTLSYTFSDFMQWDQDGTPALPNLSDALMKSPAPISSLHRNILDGLRAVATDLKEQPDSEKDNIERLAVIGRVLPMFSLEELRFLWQDVKSQDYVTVTLFVDCLVHAGSNPAIMLIKELVESKQITETKATWALAAIGYWAKTPTRELLHELINLLKSEAVQSSKTLLQTTLMTVADLMNTACGSRFSAAKRFPVSGMGDFCDRKDPVVVEEFLPLLIKELETSEEVFDRMVALTAFGALGIEEIVPVLLPVIRGTPGKYDDTAERVRAVLSLHRVVFAVPEKIHPILTSLASNVGERPEIRMAALGLLLTSNAPLSLWQKFAASTWFEPSSQVASFIHSLIHSISKAPATTPLWEDLTQKGRIALTMVKTSPFGAPFSFADIRSSHMDEGISVLMYTISHRVPDQHWPVFLANRYYYQLGPLNREPLSVYLWNYNMSDLWHNILGKIYDPMASRYTGGRARGDVIGNLKGIWEELKATSRPADKRAGLLHINLLGSINRIINLEKIEEWIPKMMQDAVKYQNMPYEVSVTKYRMLVEYNVRFATEIGLPMRFLFTLPTIVSMQGTLQGSGRNGLKSDITAEWSWKLASEIRVETPFSGNYIATGVDVLVDSRAPRELTFNYNAGELKVSWTPGTKVTDLVHFHVKPYTISRKLTDSVTPTLECNLVNLISVTDTPIKREWPLGERMGINVKLIEESESPHSDFFSWFKWLNKFDINSLSNLGFVPLSLQNRKYTLRYDPSGTRASTVSSSIHYQYAHKSSENTLVFESGTSTPKTPTKSEIVSYKAISAEFQPALERLFKNLDSGNAHLTRGSLSSEWKDGTIVKVESVLGLSKDAWYSKDFTDWQIEYSTTPSSGSKKVNYAVCYWAIRDWNKPSTYGLTKNVLYMNEEDHIGFGPQCEHKARFTAKLYRDDHAAKAVMYSPAGKQCQQDMEAGWMYGSPACTEAREMDQTYNNYEMGAEFENMDDTWNQWARKTTTWMNHILYPFIVKHTQSQSNTPNRAAWIAKRDPITGDTDMTFIRPYETVVAKNVRWGETWARYSPLSFAYAQVFYPLKANRNFIHDASKLSSGAVTESKCYVGPDGVYTFDGANYNYTINSCPHVLMTDCHKQSEIAVTAHQGRDGHKIVTVIYGKDTVELNPSGYVVVNGAKTAYKGLNKESRIEVRDENSKFIKAVVYPLGGEGVIMEIRTMNFFIKVQESQVEISAPMRLRGRTCGLCGDFNQDVEGEWKTPERCAVSAGELMAASFMLKSGEGCTTLKSDISRRLKKETETCESVDKQFRTRLPEYNVHAPSRCTRYEKMTYSGVSVSGKCESVESHAVCQPGCKPMMMVSKPFTFKCDGELKDFVAPMTVPTTCISP